MAGTQPTVAQLRPALQLALEVAAATGEPIPGRVRNLVRNRRKPANWPTTMRLALEEDEAFRKLVGGAAEEEALGRLPFLWLTRPEGWSGQLAALVEAEQQEKEASAAAARISELEGEVARTRAEAEEARARCSELSGLLSAARRDRDRARDALRVARAELESSVFRGRETAGQVGQLEQLLEAQRAAHREEVGGLRSELVRLEEELAGADRAAETAAAERSELESGYRMMEGQVDELRRSMGATVGRAASAARLLGEALAEAAGQLTGGAPGAGSDAARPAAGTVAPAPPAAGVTVGPAGAPASGVPRRPVPGPGPRRPLPLPPAVFEDSPEAATHLVRVPGVHLFVDGYNVTFTSWTGRDLPALRHRLVSALSELAVRIKNPTTVVFDGAAEGGRVAAPPVARPWLRIEFSASSVEADEVIVQGVRALPSGVPAVVVTNDRQVRQDVARLGANVLSVDQLLGVLGRQADGG